VSGQEYRSKDREAQVNEDGSLRNESHHLEEEMNRMLDLLEGDITLIRDKDQNQEGEERIFKRGHTSGGMLWTQYLLRVMALKRIVTMPLSCKTSERKKRMRDR
jgi:hypothetical protein